MKVAKAPWPLAKGDVLPLPAGEVILHKQGGSALSPEVVHIAGVIQGVHAEVPLAKVPMGHVVAV